MAREKRFDPGSYDFRNDFINTSVEKDRPKVSKGTWLVRFRNQGKKSGVERGQDLSRKSRFLNNSNKFITKRIKKMQEEFNSLAIRA